MLADGRRRHIAGAGLTIGLLQKLNALAPGLDAQAAVDTLSAVSDVEFAMMLRDSYGWSLDRIEAWITDTSRALLLADA